MTPDGAFIYVSDFDTGEDVKVISTATNTVVASVPGPSETTSVAIAPDGASGYAGKYFPGAFYAFDTATNTVTASFLLGGVPEAVAVTPDGAFVWVAVGSTIKVIDTATNTIASTISGASQPLGFAFKALSQSPQDKIEALIAQINALVAGGDLAGNKANPLITKLQQVLAQLDCGQTAAACNQLGAFRNQVSGYLSAGVLAPADGHDLLDAVDDIRSDLGC